MTGSVLESLDSRLLHSISRYSKYDMTPLLGKRKRRLELVRDEGCPDSSATDSDYLQLQTMLRKNFEANFEPLPISENATTSCIHPEEQSDDEGEDTTWEGISNTEQQHANVVQHTQINISGDEVPREELKRFMVCPLVRCISIPIISNSGFYRRQNLQTLFLQLRFQLSKMQPPPVIQTEKMKTSQISRRILPYSAC